MIGLAAGGLGRIDFLGLFLSEKDGSWWYFQANERSADSPNFLFHVWLRMVVE